MSPEERAAAAKTNPNVLRYRAQMASTPEVSTGVTSAERYSQIAAAAKAESIEGPVPWYVKSRNAVGRFFGEVPQAGDLSPKLTQPFTATGLGSMVDMMLAPTTATIGALDTLKNRDERVGKPAPLTTMATAFADTASIGTLDKLGAASDLLRGEFSADPFNRLSQIWQVQTGEPMEVFAEREEERALEQEELREANPNSALVGDVVGFAIPGAGLTKLGFTTAAKTGGAVGNALVGTGIRRLLFGSAIGSAQTAAYTLNKGGELEEAVLDAAIAGLGGILLGGAFSVVANTGKRILKAVPKDVTDFRVGKQIMDAVNLNNKVNGKPPMSASEIAQMLDDLGPDASLADVVPGMEDFLADIVRRDPAGAGANTIADFIGTRNSFFEDLMAPDGQLRSAFGATALRSYDTFSRSLKGRFEALQPRFSKIIADNKGVRFSANVVDKNIKTLFGDKKAWTADQQAVYANLDKMIKKFQKFGMTGLEKIAYNRAVRAGSKSPPLPSLSLSQLNNLKRQVQSDIGRKSMTVAKSAKPIPLTAAAIRDLTQIQAMLVDMITSKVPALAKPNAVYGNLAGLKTAYKAGVDAFSSKKTLAPDVTAFIADSGKSAAQKRAFVEGAKFHLFEVLNAGGAQTMQELDKVLLANQPVLNKMKAMFGEQATQDMLDAVLPQVIKIKTTDTLRAAFSQGVLSRLRPADHSVGKSVVDAAVAMGAPAGVTSVVSATGALSRLVGGSTDHIQQPVADAFSADMLTKLGKGASSSFEQLQNMLKSAARPSAGGDAVNPAIAAGLTQSLAPE